MKNLIHGVVPPMVTPYYFDAGQPELIAYYTQLAGKLPLPLCLYNMPSQVKVMIDVKTVVELSKHPNIRGLKDSSGNIGYFNACRYHLRGRKDFAILMGPEEAMGEAVLMGVCSDTLAAPREPFNAKDRELIRERLVELGAL